MSGRRRADADDFAVFGTRGFLRRQKGGKQDDGDVVDAEFEEVRDKK